MPEQTKGFFTQLGDVARSLFLNGLATILPIVITFAFLNLTINLLKKSLAPINAVLPEALAQYPFSEFAIAVAALFILGLLLRTFLLRSIVRFAESIVERIPLIRPVYTGVKQLVRAFTIDQATFQQVVLVEFPRKGLYSVGFLTSKLPADLAPHNHEEFINVYVPTTPNPTTGYYLVVPRSEIKEINITRQEAMALIISGGIVQPERFNA